MDGTLGRMTLGMACCHRLRTEHTVKRRGDWHAIIAFGQHKHSNNVGCGMTSPPLDCTHSRTTSGVAFNHLVWAAHTVKQRRPCHAIIAFRQQKISNDAGRGMKSPPFDSTHGWQRRAWHDITALVQHTRSKDVWRGMTSPPLDCTHRQTMSGVAFHHRLWAARTDKRRWARHDITALGQHTRSTTLGVACHHRP